MINRRSILTSILAALASGASASAQVLNQAATSSAAAAALTGKRRTVRITRAMLNDPVIGRYAKTLQLQQQLYVLSDQVRTWREINGHMSYMGYYEARKANPELHQAIYDKGDELIAYMLANFQFERTLENEYLTSDLFEKRITCDVLSIEGLASIIDVILPVAVLKHAISVEKVPFDTMKMTQFDAFAQRFKDTILGRHRPYDQVVAMYPEWAAKHRGAHWNRYA